MAASVIQTYGGTDIVGKELYDYLKWSEKNIRKLNLSEDEIIFHRILAKCIEEHGFTDYVQCLAEKLIVNHGYSAKKVNLLVDQLPAHFTQYLLNNK